MTLRKPYLKPAFEKRDLLSAMTAGGDSLFIPPQKTLSDIRLKTDIEKVGVAANGVPLYTFRYIGGSEIYRGVMAQDVLEIFPEAVSTMPNGYFAVSYDMLGMKMTRVH